MLKVKTLGKPYAGKSHVRIDEGEEEDKDRKCGSDPLPLTSSFLLYRETKIPSTDCIGGL